MRIYETLENLCVALLHNEGQHSRSGWEERSFDVHLPKLMYQALCTEITTSLITVKQSMIQHGKDMEVDNMINDLGFIPFGSIRTPHSYILNFIQDESIFSVSLKKEESKVIKMKYKRDSDSAVDNYVDGSVGANDQDNFQRA